MKYSNGGEVARTILSQLGGAGKLVAMTGAYNFVDLGNGLSFKIKNAKSNFIKITHTSLDLYNIEIGRIRGNTYKVVAEAQNLYADQLKPFIEKTTGMYLSLFARGGDVFNKLSSIMKTPNEEAADYSQWKQKLISELQDILKVDKMVAMKMADNNEMELMNYYYRDVSSQDAAFLILYSEKQFASGGNVHFKDDDDWGRRLARPTSYIEKKYLDRVSYNPNDFVGNFGWRYDGRTNEGYLLKLDDYDAMLIRPDMIKSGERVYRYITDKSVIGGIKSLIKINYEKGLLYFLVESEYDDISFEKKGIKALWISLIRDKFEMGGSVENELLEDFNIRNLDAYETMQYKHLTERGMTKSDALQFIINNVEGDYSQLSPSLAEIAEMEGEYAKGGEIRGEVGTTYYIGTPEVDKTGRFGKKRATWKTCVVDENGNKRYGHFSISIIGNAKNNLLQHLSYHKLHGVVITQKEFDNLTFSKMAKGGMTTFNDKVQAISKRLEGTKVPKRLEKDYGKRYNHDEAVQSGRRIAGSIIAKKKYDDGGTVGDSPYTDAEIRRAIQNFFVVPKNIVKNDDAYFAVDEPENFLIEGEWYINTDEYGDTIYQYWKNSNSSYNYENDIRIQLYYPIKKGYELKGGLVDLLEDDMEYFD